MDATPDPFHQLDTDVVVDRTISRCGPSQCGPGAPHGPVQPRVPSSAHMVVPQ